MRQIGLLQPTDQRPIASDTVQTLLLAGGTPQSFDWATSTGAVANAGVAGVNLVKFSGMSTAGAAFNFMVNLLGGGATSPASGTSIASSGVNEPVVGNASFQVPSSSTGWSAFAFTSGYVFAEQWHR